jgi:hypothetical protein
MEEKTMVLTLDAELAADVEAYAAQHNTSVSQIVVAYLTSLVAAGRPNPGDAPILQRLTGILPSSVSEDSYQLIDPRFALSPP